MRPNGLAFEIYIRTTPERLWEAITDPAIRAKYHFGAEIESDWTVGSSYRLGHPAAERSLMEGENLVVERPSRLVQTMRALWGPDAGRALRRMADDPVRPEDVARNRADADHSRLAHVPAPAVTVSVDARRSSCPRPPSPTSAPWESRSAIRTRRWSSSPAHSASRSGSTCGWERASAGSRSPPPARPRRSR